MAIQTFVADTILTAAQMNALQGNDYNQTVSTKTASYTLVAADKGTKIVMNSASATTITVNTSLFSAGDTLTILNIGAGVCTVTAGTATVSTTGTLALVQNAGGTLYFTSAGVSVFQADGVAASSSGLTLITAQTIGSAVSSVTVSNCFSATYANYRIIVSGGAGSTSIQGNLIFGAAATDYYSGYARSFVHNNNTPDNSGAAQNSVGNAMWGSVDVLHMDMNVFNPFAASRTIFTVHSVFSISSGHTALGGGYHNASTSFTAFTITMVGGTATGGTIRVYGYQNS